MKREMPISACMLRGLAVFIDTIIAKPSDLSARTDGNHRLWQASQDHYIPCHIDKMMLLDMS